MSEGSDERSSRPAAERAEALVDHVAPRLGRMAALAGLRLLKVAALAREEAEDIWAEAQSLRQQMDQGE